MITNRAYYLVKPFLPWRLRVALRRWRAAYRRSVYADVWPIDQKAGSTPPHWPGWPEHKRFAVVLTHDVEGSKGLARIRQLTDLESKYGFRSSFNFVPEEEYRVADALRAALDGAGFEVGVHGLNHDGKLYSSKAQFASKAVRIQKYVQHWNASGFRSPLMHHRLAWLHQLGVEYDASTFDTDPFEPESDGASTIFPFWVQGEQKNTGYVELPYTLTQDFTLFVVLRERNIDIWKQKLDWVAEHGGMVLLNTHPDYMCFEGSERARDEYPVSYYEELLAYIREKYTGAFWPALPREVTQFYCENVPLSSRNSRKKVCMVTHSNYENDNRVRRYAEALVSRGDEVDVIAISGGDVPLGTEQLGGVTVHRVQRRDRDAPGKWKNAWRLFRFLYVSSRLLTRRHHRLRYDLVHVHNIPDFLVFAAWYPKRTGTKVILDIHDIVPELFASKFDVTADSLYVKFLRKVEKASSAFADHVIVANDLWRDTLISRSVAAGKCSVFLNHVDPAMFYRHERTRTDGKIIILFPGSFQWHQGLDLAIEAFARILDRVPNAEFHIYGDGDREGELIQLVHQLGLDGRVKFCGSVPLHQVADVIANADLGIVPKRADSFGNEAYSTKIMEFMSQGIPVVVSRTKIDTFYFGESTVRFFESGDVQGMADAMVEVISDPVLRQNLVAGGLEYVDRNNWDLRKRNYLELVDSLCVEPFGLADTSAQEQMQTHKVDHGEDPQIHASVTLQEVDDPPTVTLPKA